MRKRTHKDGRRPPVRLRDIPPYEFGEGPVPFGMRVLSVVYWVGIVAMMAFGMWLAAGAPLP